jgi:dynactin complex subunit
MGRGGVEIETAEPIAPSIVAEINKLPDLSVQEQRDKVLILSAGPNVDVSGIVAFLASRGVKIEQFKKREASLEEMYTAIVKEAEQK